MVCQALIVGGGPAGSAAAITLARGGIAPRLIERSAGAKDVVCGGFLGWDALALLRELGIDAFALGARPITRLRLVSGKRSVTPPLPARAAGLSRRVLDSALLEAAQAAGAIVMRGRTVRSADPLTRTIRLDDAETLTSDALILATGKHELRGLARNLGGRSEEPSVGLRAALPPSPALLSELAGTIELHVFDHGYAGLLLQEDDTTNFCVSVSRQRLGPAGGLDALVGQILAEAPRLAERVAGALPTRFEAVAGVPYGWSAGETAAGVFRIGDQASVIASLAGDGIAIALASGSSAARALLGGGAGAAPDWQQRWQRHSRRPLLVAEVLRHAAAAPLGRGLAMPLLRAMPQLAARAAQLTRTPPL